MFVGKNMARAFICIIITVSFLAGCGSLTRSAIKGDLEGVKEHIAEGEDINAYDRWGWTPVMWAAYYNYYSIVKYILENGANVNARSNKSYGSINTGSTPLIIASYYGYPGIVRLLLKHGANPKLQNEQGETALSLAEKYNFSEIIELLEGKNVRRYSAVRDDDADQGEPMQTILLNDGSRIVGKIISQNRTHVTVKTKYTTMTIEKDRISEMKFK
jgi:hypothetical protein